MVQKLTRCKSYFSKKTYENNQDYNGKYTNEQSLFIGVMLAVIVVQRSNSLSCEMYKEYSVCADNSAFTQYSVPFEFNT